MASMLLAMSLTACGATDAGSDADVPTDTEEISSTTEDTTIDDDATEHEDDGDSKTQNGESGYLDEPIDNGYSSGKHKATIVVKDYGTIELELDADAAPITVSNFADLANQGFYDGLTFHRIMRNFMIQGGDPLGNGTGGSEQLIKGEFKENGVDNGISHKRGVISMARSNDMNSASSQFFICDADDTFLDDQYAAFGHVTDGMDVIDAIAKDAKPVDDNGTIPSKQQPVIESIKVGDGSLG